LKVLVTGGAGFIGSHVVEELLNSQYEVISIDNLVTGLQGNLPNNAKSYQVDLNDPDLEYVFELEKPDCVIHLAAQTSVTASMRDPYFDFYTNTVGTVKLLALSEKYTIKKFIFASSAAVYGEPSNLPIDENQLINPLSFYALSKYSAENYINLSDTFYGLNGCILRFSNVYGPRQNTNGEAGVVSIFIKRLLTGEDVTIYGGSQTRDFIYVKDVAYACRLALEKEKSGVFNISSCTETSIDDLFHFIASTAGIHSIPAYEMKRIGEIERSMLDNSKAFEQLDWRTHYSLLEGLKETLPYYSNIYSSEIYTK